MKRFYLLCLLMALLTPWVNTQAQETITLNGNISQALTPGSTYTFYDSGGPSANYGTSQNYTATFTNSDNITINFESFATESSSGCSDWDHMHIYDGNATTGNLLARGQTGCYSATLTTGTDFVATSGTMTIVWKSDGTTTAAGWVATITAAGTPPSCLNPKNLQESNVTAHSADLSWTAGGEETEWQIAYSTDDGFDESATLTQIVEGGVPAANLSDLAAETVYYVHVQANCGGSDGKSGWSATTSFKTACDTKNAAGWTDGFEEGIYCWNVGNMQSSSYIPSLSSSYAHEGSKALYLNAYKYFYYTGYSYNTDADSAYAILPAMNFGAKGLAGHTLKFYARQGSTSTSYASYYNHLFVGVVEDPADMSTFVQVADVEVNGTSYDLYEVPLTNYAGAGQYLVLLATVDPASSVSSRYGQFYVDDMALEVTPSCHPLASLSFSNIERLSMVVNLHPKAGIDLGNYDLVCSTSALSDADLEAADKINVNSASHTLNNLERETTYYVYVRANCDEEGVSEWVSASATTKGLTYDDAVIVADGTNTSSYLPIYGLYADTEGTRMQSIYTSDLLSDLQGKEISTLHYYADGTNSNWSNTVFEVRMGTTEQSTFSSSFIDNSTMTLVYTGTVSVSAADGMLITLDQPFTYNEGNLIIEFLVTTADGYNSVNFYGTNTTENVSRYLGSSTSNSTFLPKVSFGYSVPIPACPTVSDLAYGLVDEGTTKANVTWSYSGADYLSGFEIIRSDNPITDFSGLTGTPVDGTSFNYDDLEAAHTYYIYVRAICKGNSHDDGESEWASINFTTNADCPAVVNLSASNYQVKNRILIHWESAYLEQDPHFYYYVDKKEHTDEELNGLADEIFENTIIRDLDYGAHYYVYVASVCENGAAISAFAETEITTLPKCLPVINLTATRVAHNLAELTWDNDPLEDATQWEVGLVGETGKIVTENHAILFGLEAGKPYTAFVKTKGAEEDSDPAYVNFTTASQPGDCKQIGDGTSAANVVYTLYGNTYSQHIYTAAELTEMGCEPGTITALSFYYSGTSSSYDKTQSIYIGTTTASSFGGYTASDFIGNLNLVYGPTLLSYQAGWRKYEFTNNFVWDGVSNIVVGVLTNSTQSSASGWSTYGTSTSPEYRSIYRYKDSQEIDIDNLAAVSNGSRSNIRPNIKFCFPLKSCTEVTALAVSGLTNTEATVSWEPMGTETAWNIFISDHQVTDFSGVTAETVNDLSKHFTGLTQGTDYFVYVKPDCTGADFMEIAFTTIATCKAMTSPAVVADSEGPHGATITWVDPNTVPAGNYTIAYGPADAFDLENPATYTTAYSSTISAELTGLTGETQYKFAVKANCGGEDESRWSDVATFTTEISCHAPTGAAISSITINSATLSWEDAQNSGATYIVAYGPAATFDITDANTYTTEAGIAALSKVLTGLTAATSYKACVKSDCGNVDGESHSWSNIVSFTTAYEFPFAEAFNETSIPADWARYSGLLSSVMGGTAELTATTSGWNFGTGNNVFDNHAKVNIWGTSCKYWLVTPNIYLSQDNIQLTFDLALTLYGSTSTATPTDDDKFVVLISTDNGATWSILREWNNSGSEYVYDNISNTGKLVAIDLSNYYNANTLNAVKIAFYGESTTSGGDYNLHIDNVSIDLIPECELPVNLALTDVTASGASFSWDKIGSAWKYAVAPASDPEPADNAFSNNGIVIGENISVTVSGLDDDANYKFYLRQDCGNTMSESVIKQFQTKQSAVPVGNGWSDNFENGQNWHLINGTLTNAWVLGEATSHGGTHALYISNDGGETNAYAKNSTTVVYATKLLQFETSSYIFQYDWIANGEYWSGSPCDYLRVLLVPESDELTAGTLFSGLNSTAVPTGWKALDGTQAHQGSTAWETRTTDEMDITAGNYNLVLLWRNDGSSGNDPSAAIDNLIITKVACKQPTGLAVSNITTNGATFSWDNNGGAWKYAYALASEDEPAIENFTDIATNSVEVNVLVDNTDYIFYLRQDCGSDLSKAETISFHTLQAPAAVPYNTDFESSNDWMFINGSITNAWVYGEAAHNGEGTHALYISNDGGTTNAYSTGTAAVVYAVKLFHFEAGKYSFSYDWKAYGEKLSSGPYDYLRVFLVPATTALTAGTTLPSGLSATALPDGWIALDGGQALNYVSTWQSFVSDDINLEAGDYKVVLLWRDDTSSGNQTPAAVDNFSITTVACSKPTDLAVSDISSTAATFAWTAEEGQTEWQICLNDDMDNLIDADSNPFVVSTLTAASSYSVKVRANCGSSYSEWSNAISFGTEICNEADKKAIRYELTDQYTDGWNGAYLKVVHKASNVEVASLAVPGGQQTYTNNGTLNLCCGEEYSFVWTSGSYDGECSFVIYDVQDEVILSHKQGTSISAGVLADYTMACPTCFKPKAVDVPLANITSTAAEIQWTNGGEETAWQICLNNDESNLIDANSNPFTLTGLTAETDYSVKVRANCGESQSEWSEAFNFTTASACATPDGVAASEIDATSATITWNAYGLSDFNLRYSSDGINWIEKQNVNTPYIISNELTQLTEYQVQVQATCNTAVWSNAANFETKQQIENVPFATDFESGNEWVLINGTQTNKWVYGEAAHNGEGTHALYISNNNGTSNAYTVTSATVVYAVKLFHFEAGKYSFTYDWKAKGETSSYGTLYDYMRVFLVPATVELTAGTSLPSGLSATALPNGWIALDGGQALNNVSSWQTFVSDDIDIEAGNYKVVLLWRDDTSGGSQTPAAVDNFSITTIACPKPKALNAVAASGSVIDLSWQKGDEETEWDVQYRKQGESIWNDAVLSVEVSGNNCSAQLVGLDPQTTYEIQVRANCGADQSEWIAAEESTRCGSVAMPFVEDFNGLTSGIPECWDNNEGTTASASFKWTYYATGYEGHGVRFNSYSNGKDNTNFLKTPAIVMDAPAALSFWFKNPTGGDFSVYYTIDGGAQTPLSEATGLTGVSAWTKKEIEMPSECVGHEVVIIFKATSNYGSGDAYIYLDEISVERAVLFLDDHADNSAILAQNMGQTLNVQIGRTFTRTGYDTQHIDHYNTICLPFSLNAEQLAASPIATDDIWRLLYARVDAGADELLYRIARTDHIDAGVPYLIGFPASDEDIVNPIFENVTISATEGQKDGDPDFAQFCGILKPEPFAAGDQTKQFLYTQTNTLYWWNGNYDSQLYGFRAFFLVNTNNNSNNAPIRHGMRSRIIKEEQVATGVENINGEAQTIKRMENGMVVIIRNGVKYSIDGQVISK